MTWQDGLLIAGTVIGLAELAMMVKISVDDHAMRKIAEEGLQVSRDSLEAQEQYLALRQRWYESRMKKSTQPDEVKSS